jgi:hypothetical protein
VKHETGIFTNIIGIFWISFATGSYFFSFADGEIAWRASHIYYINIFHSFLGGDMVILPLLSAVAVIGGEYLLLCLWKRFYAGEKNLDIKLSPFMLLIIFSCFFFIIAFIWFGFYHTFKDAFIPPHTGIFSHYGIILAALGLILLICASTGKYVLNCLKRDAPYDLKEFLLSFGMGAVLITFILFILGLFGWLRSDPVWLIFIALSSWAYKELWQWLKAFFRPQIHFQGSYHDVRILLFFLFSLVLGHNVLELIRPIPIGFDDTAVYMNIPHLLARGGGLLSGIDACSWGLFMSLGYVLFHSATIALCLSFLGGVLSFFCIYVSVKSYVEHRSIPKAQANTYALLAATLFYTLPSVMFQSAKDMKVDLAAMFFMLLAFISFLSWRKEGLHGSKSLWLSGLFMGFAFTIKYTALFFIAVISLHALFQMIKRISGKRCPTMLLFIICIGAPFIPYGIKNIAETKQLSIQSLPSGKSTAPIIAANPPLTVISEQLPDISKGVQEEQGRYLGFDHGIWKYLFLPLTIVFNPVVSGAHVDIGYIFLAVIPLMIILYTGTPEREETHAIRLRQEILVAALIYWILWAIFAKGVIWYGFGGFLFLLILFVEVIHRLQNPWWTFLRYITNISIIIWLICALCLRTVSSPAFFLDPIGVAYAAGAIDEKGYLKNNVPAYLNISDIINRDIELNKENPPKVYRAGTYIKYFIHHNNTVVLDDNQLDIFIFLTQDHDDNKTIARLKNAGFKYLIIDTNTLNIDKTPEKTLRAKYQELTKFIERNKENIKTIIDEPEHAIKFFQIL